MANSPKISVVMPVFNGEKYLGEAMDSILNQTCKDFEFIIIDDASTDGSHSILRDYSKGDDRIKLKINHQNAGIVNATNFGIYQAKGDFIALMDQDDVSLPQRLEKELVFFEKHPGVGVCGTWRKNIDSLGNIIDERKPPISNALIKWNLFLGKDRLVNPSVMIRRELFKLIGGYDEDFQTTQDYDLWRRLIKITKFANLPEFLLLYRVHEENASKVFPDLQRNNSIRIAIDLMNDLLGDNSGYSFFAESTGNKDKIIVKVKILMRVYHEFSFQEKLTNDEKKLIRQDVGKRIIKMVKPLLKKYPHLIYWYIFGRIWRYI